MNPIDGGTVARRRKSKPQSTIFPNHLILPPNPHRLLTRKASGNHSHNLPPFKSLRALLLRQEPWRAGNATQRLLRRDQSWSIIRRAGRVKPPLLLLLLPPNLNLTSDERRAKKRAFKVSSRTRSVSFVFIWYRIYINRDPF